MREMVAALTLLGCNAPCMDGFYRDGDGICRAEEPCSPGMARGADLECHSDEDGLTDQLADTGEPKPDREDTGVAGGDDADSVADGGPGRIRVLWNGLSGVPAHGVVVMATADGDVEPSAALCVVVLQLEIDIDAYLRPYTPGDDPCAPGGEPMRFDEGPIEISMEVVAGEGATPVRCDERDLRVSGDVTVDFSGVESCDM